MALAPLEPLEWHHRCEIPKEILGQVASFQYHPFRYFSGPLVTINGHSRWSGGCYCTFSHIRMIKHLKIFLMNWASKVLLLGLFRLNVSLVLRWDNFFTLRNKLCYLVCRELHVLSPSRKGFQRLCQPLRDESL